MVVPKMREPNPRIARYRTLDKIRRESEQKKAALQGPLTPSAFKGPRFYMGLVLVLVVVGLTLTDKTDKALKRQRDSIPQEIRTLNNLDALAEALGRYHFHTGVYPTASQGLAALVREPWPEQVPGWDGPYINQLRDDAWDKPFVYAPPDTPDTLPTLFSCGPDGQPGTPDDLTPDPTRFNPGTEWTNGWVSATDRLPGVRIYKP